MKTAKIFMSSGVKPPVGGVGVDISVAAGAGQAMAAVAIAVTAGVIVAAGVLVVLS